MGGTSVTGPVGRIRGSFSLKLLVLFGVVLLAIGGFGGLIYAETANALEQSTEEDVEHATNVQAGLMAQWIAHGRDHVRSVAAETAARERTDGEVGPYLERQAEGGPQGTVATHYVGSDGEVLATSGSSRTSYADVSWWAKSPAALAAGVQGPYQDPTTGERALAFVAPVPESDARIVAVVDLQRISDAFEDPTSVENSYITVADSSGILLSSYASSDGPAEAALSERERTALTDLHQSASSLEPGETGFEVIDLHGEPTATGYTTLRGTNAVLMVHVPRKNALALQQDVTRLVIGLVAVSLLGLGIVGIVVGRSTTGALRQLARSAEELEDGNLDIELDTGRTDEIGRLYDAFDSMRRSLKESLEDAEEAREAAEQQRKELSRLVSELEAQAGEFADATALAADGDLTQRMDVDGENEAMEEMASEFNEMVAEIESTILEISQFADRVAVHGEEVTASAEEVKSASEQVSDSVQTISSQTERQAQQFHSVTDRMGDLTATTEEIASLCDQVSTLAERTATTGQQGRNAADQATTAMVRIDDGAERAVAEIRTLSEQMRKVEEIAEFISEVAEQTNMIALNANIEASRNDPGTDDSGFAAVAEEVKEMATDTKDSAEEIEAIIDELEAQTESVVSEVEDVQSVIDESTTTVQRATGSLDEIADFAEQTYTGVQRISTATQQQAAVSEEVLSMVEEAAELSEQVDEEASTVASAAEEQTSALTEVTDNATQLTEQARRLRSHLDAFRVENAPKRIPATDD